MGKQIDQNGPFAPLVVGVAVLIGSAAAFGVCMLQTSISGWSLYLLLLGCRAIQGIGSSAAMAGGMTLLARMYPPGEDSNAEGEEDDSGLEHFLEETVRRRSFTETSISSFTETLGAGGEEEEMGREDAMGTAQIGVALGAMSGAPIAGVLADGLGSSSPFFILAGIAGVAMVMVLLVKTGCCDAAGGANIDDLNADEEEEAGDEYAVYKNRYILGPAGALVLANAGVGAIEPLVPLYLAGEPFIESSLMQGVIFASATAGYLICTPIATVLSKGVIAKWKLMLGGLVLVGIGLAVMGIEKQLWVLIVGLAIIGVGMAFVETPSLTLFAEVVDAQGLNNYGATFALQDMSTSLGFILGPLLAAGGQAIGLSLLAIGGIMGLICVGYSPVVSIVSRMPPQES